MGGEIQLNNCLSRFNSFVLRATRYFIAMVAVAMCKTIIHTEF